MAQHLALRSGNPALTADTFRGHAVHATGSLMTVSGTVNKTAFALLILVATASFTWGMERSQVLPWMLGGLLGSFACAIALYFKHAWAPMLTPAYAALEGLALGGSRRASRRATRAS